MVRIVDKGSHFDALLDKVWKLIEAHQDLVDEIHSGAMHPKREERKPSSRSTRSSMGNGFI
ncbi:MAG: hypothetical protein ACREDE_00075 [Thermoplasmata archaeon]